MRPARPAAIPRLVLSVLLLLLPVACSQPPEAPVAAPAGPPGEAALSEMAVGIRRLEQFDAAAAEAAFRRALELRPDWPEARLNLAIAQLNAPEPEGAVRAEASARAALAAAPGDARAAYVLGLVLAERLGRFADALAPLRTACEAAPADASAWTQRARAAEEASRAGEPGAEALRAEAREAYEKAVALDARALEPRYRLGRLLLDSGDAADQSRATTLLGEHARLLAGRPAVQPNYLTRGALALAVRPRATPQAPAVPAPVALVPSAPLSLPAPALAVADAGNAVQRFRDGITVADADGDGRLDVLAPLRDPARPQMAWWTQRSPRDLALAGTFGDTGAACASLPAGDVEHDGDLDLLLTCSSRNVLLLRDGDRWTDGTPADMAFPSVAALRADFVDVDHDGDLDVHGVLPATRERDGWAVGSRLWINDGFGRFSHQGAALGLAGSFASEATLWADLTGDNGIDLVALPQGAARLALLVSERDAPFRAVELPLDVPRPAAGTPVLDLEVLDPDGDDDLDLVVLSEGRLTLLVNDSSGGQAAFRAVSLGDAPAAGSALAVADLDLDGTRELLLLAPAEPAGTTRGELLRAGGEAAPSVPVRVVGADGLDPEVIAPADLDADGAVDLVLRRVAGEPVILWNAKAPGATSLRLSFAGRAGRSNAQGFGAKVVVDAGSLHVAYERRPATGLAAHVVAPDVVGLGGRARADGVTTLWPSGIRQGDVDLAASAEHAIAELDRQASSCPMLYGWDGTRFAFLTDCFDTAPLGLWVAPGVHWAGDPDEMLRLREGWAVPQDGVVNLSIAEFLNETLLADAVSLVAVDHDPTRRVIVDEGVRLAAPPPRVGAWLVGEPRSVRARQAGEDASARLAEQDGDVAGWTTSLPWTGLAEPHALELEPPSRDGLLVLTGALSFANSAALFAASQHGVVAQPARLEVKQGSGWREVAADCGLPAGFHKDVVIDLRGLRLPEKPVLRISTNLKVSWDRAVFFAAPEEVPAGALRPLPLLRAEKRWLGIPREVKGPEDRWRSFPREDLDGASPWIRQDGPVTPDGDVRAEIAASDERLAFVRPGEELLLAWDDAALPVAPGLARTRVLVTRGWVKDATPHTHAHASVLPLPRPGAATYP